jgi:hypothetical protein
LTRFFSGCDEQTAADVAQMKGQMVSVDQAAGIQFQGETKRPSGPAFIIWSIPTKRTLADAAGKAGDADNGPIGAALTNGEIE